MEMDINAENGKISDELVGEVFEDSETLESIDGKLRVDGTVFIGSIQRRVKSSKNVVKTSNVVKTIGYKITNLETNEWLYMEKMEAIDLVRQLGVVNATIRPRRNDVKDEFGKVISTNFHLNLHPVRQERPFTDADRLFPTFKLDKNGKIVKPTELFLKEEECTELLWEVIEDAYKKRKPSGNGNNGYVRISEEEKLTRIEKAMQAANFKGASNPFSE